MKYFSLDCPFSAGLPRNIFVRVLFVQRLMFPQVPLLILVDRVGFPSAAVASLAIHIL